jgi:hypothetical protein
MAMLQAEGVPLPFCAEPPGGSAMKGEVVYLYAFDVAYEIVTSRVQEILATKPFPFTIRTERTFPRDVPLYQPLAIELPPLPAQMRSRPVHVLIRVYSLGVVTVAFRVGFETELTGELSSFHRATLEDGRTLDEVARGICAEVYKNLREFMIRGTQPSEPEAYTVFCLTEMAGVEDVNQWLRHNRRAIAGLLSETAPERISENQVREALRIRRSFENTDVVVIDWDAALVVDLGGYVEDVLYVLELANLQLEEFRVMDRGLDRYLDQSYEQLERVRWPFLGGSAGVLRALRRFRVDLTKLADEVTHITKFFGDWYLARVYLGARDRFYLDHWRQSVEQRLAQVDQLYTVVQSEIYERRMFWLELIIVFLFIIDVLALFFWRR